MLIQLDAHETACLEEVLICRHRPYLKEPIISRYHYCCLFIQQQLYVAQKLPQGLCLVKNTSVLLPCLLLKRKLPFHYQVIYFGHSGWRGPIIITQMPLIHPESNIHCAVLHNDGIYFKSKTQKRGLAFCRPSLRGTGELVTILDQL